MYGNADLLVSFTDNLLLEWYGDDLSKSFIVDKIAKPHQFKFDHKIKDAACGISHSIVVLENGKVYSRGSNMYGQLGLSNNIMQLYPRNVDIPQKIKHVACCKHSTFVIDINGNIWGWGQNNSGQLGIGHYYDTFAPQNIIIPGFVQIKKIVCGEEYVIAISVSGLIYGWGDNSYNKINTSDNKKISIPSQILLPRFEKINKISCGKNHITAISCNNKLICWGDNKYGQLGLGNFDKCNFPTFNNYFKNIGIIDIHCINNSTFVYSSDHKLYSWGENENYQLCLNNNHNHNIPQYIDYLGIVVLSHKY